MLKKGNNIFTTLVTVRNIDISPVNTIFTTTLVTLTRNKILYDSSGSLVQYFTLPVATQITAALFGMLNVGTNIMISQNTVLCIGIDSKLAVQ